MKRIDENTISLTQQELDDIREFIRFTLNRTWDRHANNCYFGNDDLEEGMRRMDPEMYDLANKMGTI